MRPGPIFVGGWAGRPKRNSPIGRRSTWPGRNRNGDFWSDAWQNWPTKNYSRRPVDSGGGRTTISRAVDGAPEELGRRLGPNTLRRERNYRGDTTLRFMVIVKASPESEAGVLPTPELLAEMMKYNEELVKAGVMLSGDGLHASSKGVRVKFSGGKTTVTDGPFTETKELIAGFGIFKVKSKQEAIDWVKRAPMQDTELEIRQIFEADDFGDNLTPSLKEKEARLRAQFFFKKYADHR